MIKICFEILILLLKFLGAYLLYERVLRRFYLRWLYGRRGVTFFSKVPIPFVGDIGDLIKRVNEQPDRPHITALFHEKFGYEAPGCIGMFWPHNMELIISDPDYLQDLFVTYNDLFDKESHARKIFSSLTWDSILWAKSVDPSYKPRR